MSIDTIRDPLYFLQRIESPRRAIPQLVNNDEGFVKTEKKQALWQKQKPPMARLDGPHGMWSGRCAVTLSRSV
jgi:hypothetical protein